MNKKLVKRVAVASLAALMTIPNLTVNSNITGINTVYAGPHDYLYGQIAKLEEKLKKAEAEGNIVRAEEIRKDIEHKKNFLKRDAERTAEIARHEAERVAKQAEKDRIANTVYPLTAKYVKDFVPAVDDGLPHFYERPELPGVIFKIEKDKFGDITEYQPNYIIEDAGDFHRRSHVAGTNQYFDDIFKLYKVKYISPFNFFGRPEFGEVGSDMNNAYLRGGWCHWIGENMEVYTGIQYEKLYADGWPEEYIGKSVNEIGSWHENFQPVKTAAELLQAYKDNPYSAYIELTTAERNPGIDRATGEAVNAEYGSSNWMFEQDIYSVAREHGTD